jgi:hypothetical protein
VLAASFAVLLFSSLVNFFYATQILRKVSSAEIKLSFFEMRWQVHKHMKLYRQLCRQDTGRLGVEYYGYWLSLVVMIGAALVMFYQLPWHTLE